ncbi:hypothetical protein ACVWWQ_002907 [Rhodanobacter sp. TND4EL1]
MWKPRSASRSAVTLLGGLPEVQRVDQLPFGQVIDAWRSLPSRVRPPQAFDVCV